MNSKKVISLIIFILLIIIVVITCIDIFKEETNTKSVNNTDNSISSEEVNTNNMDNTNNNIFSEETNTNIINSSDNNISEEKNYKLELYAEYGGVGVGGNNLESGEKEQSYDIEKGDKFYEPAMGGLWIKNDSNIEHSKLILEVIEIDDNEITLKNYTSNGDKDYTVKYDESIDIPSTMIVYDGINYKYSIKFKK